MLDHIIRNWAGIWLISGWCIQSGREIQLNPNPPSEKYDQNGTSMIGGHGCNFHSEPISTGGGKLPDFRKPFSVFGEVQVLCVEAASILAQALPQRLILNETP